MNLTDSIIQNIAIFFGLIGILGLSFFSSYEGDLNFAFEVPIGLLAFVGIFYPLVYRPAIKNSRDRILSCKWAELKKFVNSKTNEINSMMIRKNKDTYRATEILSEISEKIGVFENESNILNVENHVKKSIAFSFITILLAIIVLSLKRPYYISGDLTLNVILLWSLLAAIYYSLRVVISWHRIQEY